MKAGSAFIAGVIAGIVILLAMLIGWLTGTFQFNAPMLLGSFITGYLSVATWTLGLLMHLLICGLAALIYAAIFEAAKKSAWWLGMVIGAASWVISGSLLPLLVFIHPLVPQVIIGPGAFTYNYGASNMLWFCGLHLLYGAVVGTIYAQAPALDSESTPTGLDHSDAEPAAPVANGEAQRER